MFKLLAPNASDVHICGHRGHSAGAPEIAAGVDLLPPVPACITHGVVDAISGDDAGFPAELKAAGIAK